MTKNSAVSLSASINTRFFRIFLIQFLLLCVGLSQALVLIDSSIHESSSTLLGTTTDYAVLEASFDQELFLREEWPCPCEQDSCSQTPNPLPPVDQSFLNITTLREGEWIDVSLGADVQSRYFRVDWEYSDTQPCRQLVLEFDRITGSSSAFVANGFIPRVDNYRWSSVSWGKRRIWICQSGDKWHYGPFYILTSKQVPSSLTLLRVRYFFLRAQTCPAPSSEPTPPTADTNWLTRNYQTIGSPYKIYFPTRCASVCISARSISEQGDVDVYVSRESDSPGLETAEWLSNVDGDDTICLSTCNLNSSASDLTLFIGVATASNAANFSVVASTTFQTPLLAISSLGYSASSYLLSYRAFELSCPNFESPIDCSFAVYEGCREDGYGCCDRVRPIPPTVEPSPLWPWDESDPSFPSVSIPFKPTEPLVSGKLAFAVTLRRYSLNSYFAPISSDFSYASLKNCSININGILMDSTGAGVAESIGFPQQNLRCSTVLLQDVLERINSTINEMYISSDGSKSLLLHHQLAMLLNSADFRACQTLVDSLLIRNLSSLTTFEDTSSCFHPVGSLPYQIDPCCNATVALSQCCAARKVPFALGKTYSINMNAVQSSCATSICSSKALESYLSAREGQSASSNRCTTMKSEYGQTLLATETVQFIRDCQLMTVGEDLRGSKCSNSTECPTGRTCNNGRCSFTTDDILGCLAERMPSNVARFLLFNWGLGNLAFERTRMIQELKQRIVSPQCFGKNAIEFRSHFWFHTEIICDDECTRQGLEPRCFDKKVCDIDPVCQNGENFCTRFWEPIPADEESCTQQKYCNWIDCGSLTTEECQTVCTNASLSSHACLRCEGDLVDGVCTAYEEITDATRCNMGLCSLNSTITDANECASQGTCSIDCPACSTEVGCTATGSCSDNVLTPFVRSDGVCIGPLIIVDGAIGCDNSSNQVPSGCVSTLHTTRSACITAGFYWHTMASTASECAEKAFACFDSAGEMNLKPQTVCQACGGSWKSVYEWTQGVWSAGEMIPLYWEPRAFLNASYLADSVDFFALRGLVEDAMSTKFSVSVASDAQCRYGAQFREIEHLSCDCNDRAGLSCFRGQSLTTTEAAGWACPFLATNITSRAGSLILYDSSITTSTCTAINIQVVPALQFKIDPAVAGLSSAVFQRSTSNPFAVVTNAEGLFVGQLLSDGVSIVSSNGSALRLDNEALLCIAPSSSIVDIDASFNAFGIATLLEDASIRPVATLVVTRNNNQICTRVTSTNAIFFAVALESNWESSSSQAQYIIGFVLYILVALFAIIQISIIMIHRQIAWQRKLLFMSFIFVFQTLRALYLIIPARMWTSNPVARYIIFEFPQFLYFTVFFSIIYIWGTITNRASAVSSSGYRRRKILLWKGFLLANSFMYFIFAIFIMLYALLPELATRTARSDPSAVCTVGGVGFQASIQQNNIRVAYRVFIATICMICSGAFVAAAVFILRPLLNFENCIRPNAFFSQNNQFYFQLLP